MTMAIAPEKTYAISGALLIALMRYLSTRPYAEVAEGMSGLTALTEIIGESDDTVSS